MYKYPCLCRCIRESLSFCVYVCTPVCVCVSALTDTSRAICHGTGSTSVGCQGISSFLTQYIIHEQLSIMNAAIPLILLVEPLLSKYSPQITCVKIVFWSNEEEKCLPMRCQTHNKVCHPYFRASCAAVDYC